MKNYNVRFLNKYLYFTIFFNLLINLFFFLQTYQNPWTSDDYQYVFGTKLFNLINEQNFFFLELNVYGTDRLIPFFTFLVQFIPENYIIWHAIVVIIFFLSSIILFLVAYHLTKNLNISFLSTVFFSLNYSISIKILSWNIFFAHIFNGFLGILSIYFFLLYLEKKKFFYLIAYLICSLLGALLSETGLIYPLITVIIVFLFKKNLSLKNFITISLPLIFYILLVFINTGKFLPLFTERFAQESHKNYSEIFEKSNKDTLYFYRSTYAPRNLKGYSIRTFDNILSSLNISSFEYVLRYHENTFKLKNFLKQNYLFAISIILLILVVLTYYTLKDSKKYFFTKNLKNVFLLYLFVLFLYSIIFFRRDLNFALSIFSSIFLANIFYLLYQSKKFFLLSSMALVFFSSSLLYSLTKFSYFGDFASRSELEKNHNEYLTKIQNGDLDKSLKSFNDFKFFFYYKNYVNYTSYLKKYKNLSLKEFRETFLLYE